MQYQITITQPYRDEQQIITADMSRYIEEIQSRESRIGSRRQRSQDSMAQEAAWKIYGPDYDAEDTSGWDIQIEAI